MTESQKEEERRSRRNDERGERTDKVTTMSSQAQFIQLYVYVDGNFPKPRIREKAREIRRAEHFGKVGTME